MPVVEMIAKTMVNAVYEYLFWKEDGCTWGKWEQLSEDFKVMFIELVDDVMLSPLTEPKDIYEWCQKYRNYKIDDYKSFVQSEKCIYELILHIIQALEPLYLAEIN